MPRKKIESVPVDLDLTGKDDYDYDQWLEYFRTVHGLGRLLLDNIELIQDAANGDGYAAARRWMEIFEEPSRMDKLYKGRIDKQKQNDIMEIAVGDDDEAFYVELIRQNTVQLNSSSISQQEVARITANINVFRKELREIRSRKPKEGTVLAKVLELANKPPVKKKVAAKPKSTKKPAAKSTVKNTGKRSKK